MRFGLFVGLLLGLLTPFAITLPVATPLERIPVDPGTTPPPTPQCFHLAYAGALDEYDVSSLPARMELHPTVLDSNYGGLTIYRAVAPSSDWRQPLWWELEGSDSLDIVYHHVPVLRLPMRGDTLIGRVSGHFALSLYSLLLAWPELRVRAIRVACEPPADTRGRS
jgi:hypothetical protein